MDTVVAVDLVKGAATPWPRLESDATLMSHRLGPAAGGRLPDQPARPGHLDRRGLAGLDQLDAYQLVSQAGEAPVANVVDPNYTLVAKLRKDLLPAAEVYGGVHGRLRQLGRDYLAGRG